MTTLQHSNQMNYDLFIMNAIPHQTKIIRVDRIRKINGSFAYIEHRFLKDGFFENLNFHERTLYLFLVLVSNRNGISWYSYDRICALTGLTLGQYIEARNSLISRDLIDFNGREFQVLSLPEKPIIKKENPGTLSDMPNLNKLIQNMFRRIP